MDKRYRPLTEEHKRKISESCRGRKITEETRRKLVIAQKGKKLSQSHREAIGNAQLGCKKSPETRAKISAALLGTKRPWLTIPENKARLAKMGRDLHLNPEYKATLRRLVYDKGVDHSAAKWWHLRSPDGISYRYKNLAEFVKTHLSLFSEEDTIFHGPSASFTNACAGLRSLSPRRKRPAGSWKGWTWVFSPELEEHLYQHNHPQETRQ